MSCQTEKQTRHGGFSACRLNGICRGVFGEALLVNRIDRTSVPNGSILDANLRTRSR